MSPGIAISEKRRSIASPDSSTSMASAALEASMTLKPAARRCSAAMKRTRISSSATRMVGVSSGSACGESLAETDMAERQLFGWHKGSPSLGNFRRLWLLCPALTQALDSLDDFLRVIRPLQGAIVADFARFLRRLGNAEGEHDFGAGKALANLPRQGESGNPARDLRIEQDHLDAAAGTQ